MSLTPSAALPSQRLRNSLCAASTHRQSTLAPADMEQLVRLLQPEPIGQWMREQGNPPEHWLLVLPLGMKDEFGGLTARLDYVRFSPLLDIPIFIARNAFHFSTHFGGRGGL